MLTHVGLAINVKRWDIWRHCHPLAPPTISTLHFAPKATIWLPICLCSLGLVASPSNSNFPPTIIIINPPPLAIVSSMEDLGYLKDGAELVGNMYTNSTTSFHSSHWDNTTNPRWIQVSSRTIQDDTLNPRLLTIFLNSLLCWIEKTTYP